MSKVMTTGRSRACWEHREAPSQSCSFERARASENRFACAWGRISGVGGPGGRNEVLMNKPNKILDQAIQAMRNNSATADQVEGAALRVLHNLQSEHNKVVPHPAAAEAQGSERIRSCDDFRALIPAYL